VFVVVFDTNILISAALSLSGKPFRCLSLVKSGRIQSVTCREILDEFREKLLVKLEFTADRAKAAVDEVVKCSRVIEIAGTMSDVVADPRDDKILECAVTAKASHIVTGDKKHLLALGSYQNVQILSAADLLAAIGASSDY
jgi:putative PIN family toxin of toxin-antitoxin system